jgi:heme A synthase
VGGEALTVDDRGWQIFSAGLFLMSLYTFLGGEQALVLWVRGMARTEGWYELRRPIQVMALVIALVAGFQGFSRIWSIALGSELPLALALATAGMGMLTLVFCLHLVSYHYTDAVLDQDFSGLRIARWLELGSLGLVLLGALLKLMFTYSLR